MILQIIILFIYMDEYVNRRIWDKEKGLSYFCKICGQYKPEKDFYKSKRSKWGVEPRCKLHFTKRDEKDDPNDNHLKFQRLTEEDFKQARRLLKLIGYDTSKNISEQFNKKHNIKQSL